MDLADSAQVPRVQVQVPKSNEAKPSWTWGLGLGRGGLELKLHEVPTTDFSQVRRVQVQVHRGEAEVYLNLDEAYLS